MKKKLALAIASLLITINRLRAQQWAMDEVYDDYRDTRSDDTSFGSGLLGLLILAAAIFVIWLIVQLFKNIKTESKTSLKKMKGVAVC